MIFQNFINRLTTAQYIKQYDLFLLDLLRQRAWRQYVCQYWWTYRHCMSWNINDMHCELDHAFSFPSVESPWTQWTLSGWSIGTRVHVPCPTSPWTTSIQSMDNVHSVHGQCPLRPWTMSTESMDSVHSVPGLFPWVFPTLYLVHTCNNPTKLNAYVQFTMHVIFI